VTGSTHNYINESWRKRQFQTPHDGAARSEKATGEKATADEAAKPSEEAAPTAAEPAAVPAKD
jgi:hypothetical protein